MLGFLLKTQMLIISNQSFIVSIYCVITEVVNPKDAKEAAKRLVESGICSYIMIIMYVSYVLGLGGISVF